MISFEMVKALDLYKKTYENFSLPVLLSSTSLDVYWSNEKAKSIPQISSSTKDLTALFAELDSNIIIEEIEKKGNFSAKGIFPFFDITTYFLPIYNDKIIIGLKIILIESSLTDLEQEADFVSKISNEFVDHMNSSLQCIFSTNDNMLLKSDLLDIDWAIPYIEQINLESYKLLRLSSNINVYSNLQNHLIVPDIEAFNLSDWLRKIEPIVSALINEVNIKLALRLPKKDVLAPIDIKYFQVALFNLLHNCIYYSKEGTEIAITLKELEHNIEITIEDHGLGIKPKELERISKPFVSNGLTGVGLGIPIASRIIKLHKGEFKLEQGRKKGVKAMITLPNDALKYKMKFAQNAEDVSLLSKFSPIYVGLTSALDSPYRSKTINGYPLIK